jgi:hypothetical protein
MIFLQAMWHSLKVLAAGLYWLLFVCLIWAGLAQLGAEPHWGWACLAVVLGVFAARGLLLRKYSSGVRDVAGCGAFFVFMAVAWIVTGYKGS